MAERIDWDEIERYTQKRRKDSGDVYGWFRPNDEDRVAVILAAETSPATTFPSEIGGIRVKVKNVTAPEKQD